MNGPYIPGMMNIMVNRVLPAILLVLMSSTASSEAAKVRFVGDFETGHIQSNGAAHDGFYVATLPNPQTGAETLHSGMSDFGPASNADTKVVRSDTVGGEIVHPRKGTYFLRSEIFRDKNYLDLNGYSRNKPRSKIYMSDPALRIDFDKEGYVGFSIFTPKNFENELGIRDQRGESMLFVMNADSSRTQAVLAQWVEKPASEAHWFFRIWHDDSATEEGSGKIEIIDLGPVKNDIGLWTDFVIRYRFNPFSVATNPFQKGIKNAKDELYQGNKGILQLWKAVGPTDVQGDRKMNLMVDRVDTPIGLVPHQSEKIKHLWRIYKFGWVANPTTLTHSIWYGFDEIRQGLAQEDGTTYADVAPSLAGCTENCSEHALAKPKPPSGIAVQ